MRSRSFIRPLAAWLVLAGVLFRGLIPSGFMPAFDAAAADGALLAICSAGELKILAAPLRGKAEAPAPHDQSSYESCAYALAGAATLPASDFTRPDFPRTEALENAAAAAAEPRRRLKLSPPSRAPPLLV